LPQLPDVSATRLHPPEEPVGFPTTLQLLMPDNCGVVDAEVVIPALASCSGLQAITGLDRSGLLRRFMIEWTVEGALKDCQSNLLPSAVLN
jgi:protein EFR3